ncbi:MAG: rod shape-determining protein MreC [Pseudomonadales bacterium]|nr:rod shape-determining protein MreC [Pseudomonadales bacterium]
MAQPATPNARHLLALALASFVLLAFEQAELSLVVPVRSVLTTAVSPILHLTESPYRAGAYLGEFFSSHATLRRRNAELERESLRLQGLATRYEAVLEENDRLRRLFDSRTRLRSDVLIAELIEIVPDPARHEVVIDKGGANGVAVGQAVVDSTGVVGQIVEASLVTSRVLLITDVRHSLPVEVLRNNLRTIAAGTGSPDRLVLKDVPVTAGIREGDRLVTSGLGQRFPFGYPVGVVVSVVTDQMQGFAEVEAEPDALLDRSRHLLVVFPTEAEANPQQAPIAAPTSGAPEEPT